MTKNPRVCRRRHPVLWLMDRDDRDPQYGATGRCLACGDVVELNGHELMEKYSPLGTNVAVLDEHMNNIGINPVLINEERVS